jgi:hypothetical protein
MNAVSKDGWRPRWSYSPDFAFALAFDSEVGGVANLEGDPSLASEAACPAWWLKPGGNMPWCSPEGETRALTAVGPASIVARWRSTASRIWPGAAIPGLHGLSKDTRQGDKRTI